MTTMLIALIGVHSVAILDQSATLTEVALSGSKGMKTMDAMIATMNHGKKYMEVKPMTVEERARELFFSMDKVLDARYRKTIIAAFEQSLRDQIEDCAKVAHDARTEFQYSDEKAWYGALVIENRIRARSEEE